MSITFEPGTSISRYRVIAPLGAGGMGEVYKAHDLTLDRTLALKILPPELVRNDERVRRFVQEAKSASSLNHPNIVTIYDIGQHAPSADGGEAVHYIAMELIDGATLKRKIHSDDTDLRTLLAYLAQAAEGLAKAHAAGIIHRDLKPENIMVTRDGYAKVLDFGLAKLNVKRSAETTTDPTAVQDNTREGTLLGTVGYMSPEQVQGKSVDQRSDIFSFGSILYEAATKRRPFEADSDIDIMHKIVHDKPPAIDEINPAVPAELRRLIRRCLAKDPEKRHQSMKNLSLELMEIVEEFEQLSASGSSRTTSASNETLALANPRRNWVALLAALVVIAALAFGLYQWRQAQTVSRAPDSFSSMQLTQLTISGDVQDVAISPDGKYVAQVARNGIRWSLSVRQVATGSDVEVIAPGPLPLYYVTFGDDGDYLQYVQYDNPAGSGYGTLYQIPTLGGAPRKLAFDVDSHVTFSPDGKQMAFVRGQPQVSENVLIVASAGGSNERKLLTYKRLGVPVAPDWSPDGRTILLPSRSPEGGMHGNYLAIDVDSGQVQHVGGTRWEQSGRALWLPDGSGFVTAAMAPNVGRRQIWRQPYPAGEPVRITNDLNAYEEISMTADGNTLAALQVLQQNHQVLIGSPGAASGLRPFTNRPVRLPFTAVVAANGVMALDTENEKGTDIAVIDAPGALPRMVTNDGKSIQPSITSDGRTIAFRSMREDGLPKIFVMDADGSNVRLIGPGTRPIIAPDGRYVIFAKQDTSLWRVALPAGQPQQLAERTNFAYAISPDSTRIAYNYRKIVNNRNVVYVAVIPQEGGPPTADIPMTSPLIRWDPSGEAITFGRPAGGGINIFNQPLSGGEPKQITDFDSGVIASFDWTADGKLVVVRAEVRSDAVLIRDFR